MIGIERYRLIKEVPLFTKGECFDFEHESGLVFMVEDGKTAQYALRTGLAGYLWLLRTEKGYFRRV